MNTMITKLIVKLQTLSTREEGQDLVEYALLLAVIATAAIASAGKVAAAINALFTAIAASLT